MTSESRSSRQDPKDTTRHSRAPHPTSFPAHRPSSSCGADQWATRSQTPGWTVIDHVALHSFALGCTRTCAVQTLASSHSSGRIITTLLTVPPTWVDFSWELVREDCAVRKSSRCQRPQASKTPPTPSTRRMVSALQGPPGQRMEPTPRSLSRQPFPEPATRRKTLRAGAIWTRKLVSLLWGVMQAQWDHRSADRHGRTEEENPPPPCSTTHAPNQMHRT